MKKIISFVILIPLLLLVVNPVMAEGHLVVLMYHRFDAGVSISTPMDQFKRQIRYLKNHDYHFVTLPEVKEHLERDEPFQERSVLITIDDGYRSTYTRAYPFLRKENVPWVLYVYTEAIQKGYGTSLTWPMIQEMANNGVDIENHSYSHSKFIFDHLTDSWVERELLSPHRLLEEKTGQSSQSFAIPYGMYDRKLIRILRRDTDYDFVFHIDPGVVDPRRDDFLLPRFGINRNTSWEEFQKKLSRLPLFVERVVPPRGSRLSSTPDTVSVTFSRPDRVRNGPINVFLSEFGGLDWRWDQDRDTVIAEIPSDAKKSWNRLIVTAFDSSQDKYRYYSQGLVFE